ncbi:signal peptidase II [Candidatus Uhrbacteria bacterium]|nr:signal peptidase II [Candidatus Uhrbacteria bacterium]
MDAWTKAVFFAWGETDPGSFIIAHKNYGISFNIPLPLWLTVIIAVAALAWAMYTLWKLSAQTPIMTAPLLGIFIGGVLGNLTDRLVFGYVHDWLLLFGRSAVNLADGAILLGLIGYILLTQRKKSGTG